VAARLRVWHAGRLAFRRAAIATHLSSFLFIGGSGKRLQGFLGGPRLPPWPVALLASVPREAVDKARKDWYDFGLPSLTLAET